MTFANFKGGSGAIMNEIGLVQRRLLDEGPSSAAQQLPSTDTLYSTDSVQSAPFPTIPSSYPYPAGQFPGESALHHPAANGAHANGNQILLPNRRDIYDLNSQGTTDPVDLPSPDIYQQPIAPIGQCAVNPPQEAQTQQTIPYSPHDTEPISSVVSTRLGGSKSSTTGNGINSPQQSQTSTYDELALPAAPPITQLPAVVEPTVAKKKRGRPKKQPLPENDEDDELANSRDHEFKNPGANGAIDPSDSEETTENDTPASSGVSHETDEQNLGTAKPDRPAAKAKESKKKQPKKTKSTPAAVPDSDSDDIIWIDTKPIDAEPIQEITNPHTERDIPTQDPTSKLLVLKLPKSHQLPTTSTPTPAAEQKTQPTTDKPAPKKRGRKRKQPAEHEEAPTPTDTPEPNNPEAQSPGSKFAVVVGNGPESAPEPQMQTEPLYQGMSNETNPAPAPATKPVSELPQTPSKPDSTSLNTPKNAGKGPDKHSPISARSGVPYRVGLSKRARIAPLLKMVRK